LVSELIDGGTIYDVDEVNVGETIPLGICVSSVPVIDFDGLVFTVEVIGIVIVSATNTVTISSDEDVMTVDCVDIDLKIVGLTTIWSVCNEVASTAVELNFVSPSLDEEIIGDDTDFVDVALTVISLTGVGVVSIMELNSCTRTSLMEDEVLVICIGSDFETAPSTRICTLDGRMIVEELVVDSDTLWGSSGVVVVCLNRFSE